MATVNIHLSMIFFFFFPFMRAAKPQGVQVLSGHYSGAVSPVYWRVRGQGRLQVTLAELLGICCVEKFCFTLKEIRKIQDVISFIPFQGAPPALGFI